MATQLMRILAALFALLVAAAGWHYTFYSRAARNLSIIEDPRLNLRRVRLRQINGVIMMLLAVGVCAGVFTFDSQTTPQEFLRVWFGVMVLLIQVVVLALIDVRLTWMLNRRRQGRRDNQVGKDPGA
jgi:hypothetical protein